MDNTRRNFLAAMGAFGALSIIPKRAHAFGFLEGTWVVRCQAGHDNMVGGMTRDHVCEGNGRGQSCGLHSVSEGAAWVICPNGHGDFVDGITRQHECDHCGAQCRR